MYQCRSRLRIAAISLESELKHHRQTTFNLGFQFALSCLPFGTTDVSLRVPHLVAQSSVQHIPAASRFWVLIIMPNDETTVKTVPNVYSRGLAMLSLFVCSGIFACGIIQYAFIGGYMIVTVLAMVASALSVGAGVSLFLRRNGQSRYLFETNWGTLLISCCINLAFFIGILVQNHDVFGPFSAAGADMLRWLIPGVSIIFCISQSGICILVMCSACSKYSSI